jgi:hypothetical protein
MRMAAIVPGQPRQERRKKRKQADLGPSSDPIRQQGRDPDHAYEPLEWFSTSQSCDRSRSTMRARIYHQSYRTSSGHTWDHFFEDMAESAREFEEAGINLGWGNCHGPAVNGSVEQDRDRRYLEPKANRFYQRLVAKGRRP